jgi:hypothetical protein
MAKRPKDNDDFDGPWKEALQVYLPFFLTFFFSDIHADVDWDRGYQSLDKEFQQIARRAKVGKCLADKLFKVWLKDGGERWLLIHIEIQGEYEEGFAQRMFDYNVAARQLYNQTVVSLAVLCDERRAWRPTTFSYGQWGCKMELTFRMAKVLDYVEDTVALEKSDNPFAAVVLAHWQTRQTRQDPLTRQQWKLRVVKGLYQRNWTKEDIRQLFRLIDWMMALPEPFEKAFNEDFFEYQKEKNMPYISTSERVGFRKGVVKGKEEGLRQGLLKAISETLDARFGRAGHKFLAKVQAITKPAELLKFIRFLS